MKLGISSYSLYQDIQAGKMTIQDALQWAAGIGAGPYEGCAARFFTFRISPS